MSKLGVTLDILNQKGTPAFYSDIFTNRPAAGFAGRVFISTDTGAIYEDTGSTWTLIADAGAGTTGTLQQVTTNGNSTTLPIVVQNMLLSKGAGTGSNNTGLGINALVSNTTGLGNTAIGSGSLLNNSTGNYNTAIGYSALSLNTNAIGNTAIGYNSLGNNLTGQYNVALGFSALTNNVSTNQNTAIGYSALNANTASGNTGIGYAALTTNTTGIANSSLGTSSLANNTTGSSNTGIGYSALNANQTGGNNTAIGYYALSANSSASGNTAIGYNSLKTNTTGASNTAVGYSALSLNLIGVNNAALGYNALGLNTGDSNTAVGAYSLGSNTTGTNNTAVGNSALSVNTTGAQNTAIGNTALQSNSTGGSNTAVGHIALLNNTGDSNTGIGRGALTLNTSGTFNTGLGYGAGSVITTGSNNVIIGSYGGTSALNSNIVLSDGAGNVRLFSNATGLIGINQAVGTPSAQVDIHTTQTYGLAVNGTGTSNAYLGFANAGTYKWRIGNTYNAGANSLDIYNVGTSTTALSFNATTSASTFSAALNGTSASFSSSVTSSGTITAKDTTNDASILMTGLDGVYGLIQANNATGSLTKNLVLQKYGGNVLLGSTTDDTVNKLQVTGKSYFSDNIGVNTSSPSVKLYTKSSTATSASYAFGAENGTVNLFLVRGDGLIGTGTAAASPYNNSTTGRSMVIESGGNLGYLVSTRESKANIESIKSIDFIKLLNPVQFNYRKKDNVNNTFTDEVYNNITYGFIADEVEKVNKELVFYNSDNTLAGVEYNNMIAILTKAIQELKAEIDALKKN